MHGIFSAKRAVAGTNISMGSTWNEERPAQAGTQSWPPDTVSRPASVLPDVAMRRHPSRYSRSRAVEGAH